MKGYNEHQHVIRSYDKGGDKGFNLLTTCNKTGKKVGSGDCEKTCGSFAGSDDVKQQVLCWKQ
ncbi:hypothetical protein [Moritella sp. F3]|uniref:hypothetical protein n=1 Tax=Moritella sp. F3 TaxID=2718882 RepID=UPI0018E1CDD1|nr:hypothetical protein [Moritella sp. F3]GIC77676.1 hypothetical protein FMO001_24030 [Moritella sp. F1]GIC82089.1 hypothetical protein FMO003_23700 [Moritella sp. F3]